MSERITKKLQEAITLHNAGHFEQAKRIYDSILEVEPFHADAHHLLGLLHHQQGDSISGIEEINAALAVQPDNSAFLYNQGVVLHEIGRMGEAELAYRNSLALDEKNASAWVNLGNLLSDAGAFREAIRCHQTACLVQPDNAEHEIRYGRSLRIIGDIENALTLLGIATAREPDNEKAHSNLLFSSHYQPGIDLAEIHRRHVAWAQRLPSAVSIHELENHGSAAADTGKSLRIGFLSPDLGNHPVGIFMAPLLERLRTRPDITTVCFSDTAKVDEFLTRNREHTDEWHDVVSLNHDELEKKLRESRLDVLIELTGHTDHNRLVVMARKPVPVQLTWAGYVGTTGLETIDYLICDSFHCPNGSEDYYTETLLRFPCDYIPYEPPPYAPEVGELPLLKNGYPIFGCLNNPAKLSVSALQLWARILRNLPEARLILKYKGMNDPAVRTRVLGWFQVLGVAPDRIEMLGQTNHVEHLAHFNHIDVALDPLPYSGGLSTCEAIWMGVPVVTLPGSTFASRHSLSHLSNAGLADTVAASEDDYVKIATDLVSDPDALARRRASMRKTVSESPLCDLDAFAEDFVSAIRIVTS